MVEPKDRIYIYSLRKEECVSLLDALDQDTSGSVPILRVRLTTLAKKADESEVEVFRVFKERYERRKAIGVFEKYVENLPLFECHDVLVDLKGDVDVSEEEQRQALVSALNETIGDDREGWQELSEDFCKKVSLNSGNDLRCEDSKTKRKTKEVEHKISSGASTSSQVTDSDEEREKNERESFEPCKPTHRSSLKPSRLPEMAIIMDQVRKWNIKFNGADPTLALKFIERVERMASSYEIPLDKLHRAMPEL